MRVRLGSSLVGLTSYTTLVWYISFWRSWGIFSNFMNQKVSVPLTGCFFSPLLPIPTPWQSLPSSLEYYVFQTFLYFGWRQSWLYSIDSPVFLSKTGIDICSSGLGMQHNLRGFAGYLLCATSTGWNLKACWVVRYLLQWATGFYVTVASSHCFGSYWECRSWEIGWWLAGISLV